MKHFWREIVETGGVRLYGLLAGMITLVLTARLIGPEGRGILAAVTSWAGLFSTIAYLSLGQVALYRSSQEGSAGWFPKTFGALLFLAAVFTAIISFIVLALYCFTGGSIFGDLPAALFFFGLLMIPLQIWEQYSSSLLTAIDHLRIYNLAQVVGRTSGMTAVIVFVGLLGGGVLGAIAGNVLAQSLVALIGIRVLWRYAGKRYVFDLPEVIFLLKGGVKLHLNAIGAYLFTQSDILLLNFYVSKAEVGWYQFACQLIGVMAVIPQAASIVLYSQMSHTGPDKLWDYQKKLGLQVLALMTLLSSAAYATAPCLILLVAGDGFKESIAFFRQLLPALQVMTVSYIMANQWIGRGLFLQTSLITLGSGFLKLALSCWLIPLFGVQGAIWATIATYAGAGVTVNTIMVVWCEINARKHKNVA